MVAASRRQLETIQSMRVSASEAGMRELLGRGRLRRGRRPLNHRSFARSHRAPLRAPVIWTPGQRPGYGGEAMTTKDVVPFSRRARRQPLEARQAVRDMMESLFVD